MKFKLNTNQYREYFSIAPVSDGVYRPFWSVMIPNYNCANYLTQTLKSILEQDPGAEVMQIEVLDNCSTQDDPEAIVNEIGQGRVSFFRQPKNVGALRNINTCIQRARGHWIHILHSDDLVMPGFYQAYENLITQHQDATLAIAPAFFVDENGKRIGVSKMMPSNDGVVIDFARLQAIQNWIVAPSVIIPRQVYEKVGGFSEQLSHTLDWEMWFRAGLTGKVVTLDHPYSCYRTHSKSDTSRLVLSGENIREAVRAVNICFAQLPKSVQKELNPQKYHWSSLVASRFSHRLAAEQQWKSSLIQALLAIKLRKNKSHLKLFLKIIFMYLKFKLRIIQP
jgi:glycosyltransferase involved in cell wall biosynthesis